MVKLRFIFVHYITILKIACMFCIMGGSLHEIVLLAMHSVDAICLSISHSFVWENDDQISCFVSVSIVINFRV